MLTTYKCRSRWESHQNNSKPTGHRRTECLHNPTWDSQQAEGGSVTGPQTPPCPTTVLPSALLGTLSPRRDFRDHQGSLVPHTGSSCTHCTFRQSPSVILKDTSLGIGYHGGEGNDGKGWGLVTNSLPPGVLSQTLQSFWLGMDSGLKVWDLCTRKLSISSKSTELHFAIWIF